MPTPDLQLFVNPLDIVLDATLWRSELDNVPKLFRGQLRELVPKHVPSETKGGVAAFSPATYLPKTTRGKDGVASITALVADLDKLEVGDLDRIQGLLGDVAALYYTTFSHIEASPKWRVVIPMSRPVTPAEFGELWSLVNKRFFDLAIDKATKDVSRLFYLPTCPAERLPLAEYYAVPGSLFDPDEFLLIEGNRNNGLTKLAGRLRRRGIEGQALFDALWDANVKAINNKGEARPLSRGVVERICQSAEGWPSGMRPVLDDAGRVIPVSPQIELPRNEKDKVVYSPAVLERILTEDKDYAGQLRLNLVSGRKLFRGKVLDDIGILDMRNRVIEKYGTIKIGKEEMHDIVSLVAGKNAFDPIQDYLRGLVWDGVSRLDTGARTYFGAESDLECMYFRLWILGAVARAMRPGCKMDNALVLQGAKQGRQKSTGLAILAGDNYFSDSALDLKNKDAYQGMRSKWIWEWSELETKFRRSDRSEIKAFLSSCVDSYRPSYGRETLDVPRRCVVASSTNEDHFLFDDTGNRRFWPVQCGDIDIEGIRKDRDQIWAEAMSRFLGGERWWTTQEEQSKGEEHAEQFTEENPYIEGVTQAITEQESMSGWDGWVDRPRLYERCGESWTGALPATRKKINHALRLLGFVNKRRMLGETKTKGFFRAISGGGENLRPVPHVNI